MLTWRIVACLAPQPPHGASSIQTTGNSCAIDPGAPHQTAAGNTAIKDCKLPSAIEAIRQPASIANHPGTQTSLFCHMGRQRMAQRWQQEMSSMHPHPHATVPAPGVELPTWAGLGARAVLVHELLVESEWFIER